MNIQHPIIHFTKPLYPLSIDGVTAIILHHVQAKTATVEEIHQWHLANGWAGFGYNEYIRKDGTVYIGRGDFVGAQCEGHNSHSYGIACEGDYDKELLMPQAQKESLIERIKYHKTRFKHLTGVFPHSYFCNTECPGKYFPMQEVLKQIYVRSVKTMITNIDEAIKFLLDEKVINTFEFRKQVCNVVQYEKEFVLAVANKILDLKNK